MSGESQSVFVSNYNYETEIDKLKTRIRKLELAARLKEVKHKAALAAARADGIEAARGAVRNTPHNNIQAKVDALLDAMERIDALTADAPEATTWDTCHEHADGCDGCTNQKCYRCGLHVCSNENCSSVVPYYHYGNQRLCDDCSIEYTEDIRRAIGPTDDAPKPEGGG